MKLFLSVFLLLLYLTTPAHSEPFDDRRNTEGQYEGFRQDAGGGDHKPIGSDQEMVEVYFVYGKNALNSGDYDAAVKYFRSGLALAKDAARFNLMLGLSYLRLGDSVMAEQSLLEARRLLPRTVEPLQLLAKLYYQSGQLAAAEKVLLELVQLAPTDSDVQKQLEQVRREAGVEAGMQRDVNSIFDLKFDDGLSPDLADMVLGLLQDAYARQGSLLDYYPDKSIQIILYQRTDYDMTTGAPPWSAGRFDGKIRLPFSGHNIEPQDLGRVVSPEYNHFLAQQISRGRAPAWFYEGLAMLSENIGARELGHLRQALAAGTMKSFADLEESFEQFNRDDALVAYEQSYSFVSYLVEQFGWHTVRDLLLAYAEDMTTVRAFSSVFSDFGLSYEILQREWRAGI